MSKKNKIGFLFVSIIVLSSIVFIGNRIIFSSDTPQKQAPANHAEPAPHQKPKYVRGIHLTSWVAGSKKTRPAIEKLLADSELNTVIIDVKEYEGEVYLPGVKAAQENNTYVIAFPDIKDYLATLKSKGIYSIARIVVFKDNLMPLKKPELAVKSTAGGLWKDHKGSTWLDPCNKNAWDYNLQIAEKAAETGFDEIQFDYIRFPSDGNTKLCKYSQAHSTTTASKALTGFLKSAHERLKPLGVNISIDVFGLTTTVNNDMGIGQRMMEMAEWVDYVCPMVYPSHYAKGEYGIPDPNKEPYRVVYLSMSGARKRMGKDGEKLRPYLQDFSLGVHYGAKEVREQIQATYDSGIGEWLLWNPRCVYTKTAFKSKEFSDVFEKSKKEIELESKPAVAVSSTTAEKPMPAENKK